MGTQMPKKNTCVSQSDKSKLKFEYKGMRYKSMAAFCRASHIPEQSIFKIKRDFSCSTQEAIDIWYERQSSTAGGRISLKKMAAFYGVPYDTFRAQYAGDAEAFIKSRIKSGLTLPTIPTWIESGWRPAILSDRSMRVLDVEPTCYIDNYGNQLLEFEDTNGVPFQIQYQLAGLWLFRAGPVVCSDGVNLDAVNQGSWYGAWVKGKDGMYLQHLQVGKKLGWSEVLKIVSAMIRLCNDILSLDNV